MSTTYIESNLSDATSNAHRALASLQEELDATDSYNQRADRVTDPELKEILLHNRNEELEHAAMLLEWLRRRVPSVDAALKTYLFSTQPITQIEELAKAAEAAAPNGEGSLGIGNLK
jgi:uncharacterized protein